MNQGPVKSWLDRLLEAAVIIVVVALLLRWSLDLIAPVIPALVVLGGLGLIAAVVIHRYRGW